MSGQPKSTNIVWHEGDLSYDERVEKLGQRGSVVWFTGLSGSGKSTVSRALEAALVGQGKFVAVLDGDNVRHGLNKDLGFSPEDRTENIRRIGEVANLFAEANNVVLTAFISPYRSDRDMARKAVGAKQFFEIYCAADLDTCEARDPKGLYKKARAGQIPEFTGISAPYEAPEKPELVLDTGKLSLQDCVAKVIELLNQNGIWQ